MSVTATSTDAPRDVTFTFEEQFSSTSDTASGTFEAGDANSVVIDTEPASTQTAGQVIDDGSGGYPTVKVTDANSNPVQGVDVDVSENGEYTLDSGTTTQSTGSDGIATFNDLKINTADTGYQLDFSIDSSDDVASDNTANSQSFEVDPASASKYVFSGVPSSVTAGNQISFEVDVQDTHGNLVDTYGSTADVTTTDGDDISTTLGFSSGEATFQSSDLSTETGTQSIKVDNGSFSDTTSEFSVDYTVSDSDNLQNTIDAASADQTITVESGTYDPVSIDTSGITLNGANSGTAHDGSRNTESVISSSSGLAVDINADGVTIDGFEINGATDSQVVETSSTGTTTIKNNLITPDSSGVSDLFTVRALGQVTFEGNKISEGADSDAFGIRSKDGDDFSGSTIDGNLFTDLKVGVQTEDDGTVTINNNEFSSLEASGVYAVANSDVSEATYKVNSNSFNNLGNAVDFHAKGGNLEGTLEVKNNDITDSNNLDPKIGAVRAKEDNGNTVSEVDATENYWGSNDPDFEALTTGDVESDPWSIVQKSSMDDTAPSIDSVETKDAGVPSGSVIAGSDDSASSSNNGQVDQLVVTFDEAVQDRTVDSGDLSVDSGYSIDSVYNGGTADNDTVVVELVESGSSDTGATPTLSVDGAIADYTGNTFSSGSQTASDNAAPVLTETVTRDADSDDSKADNGKIDQVQIKFSEAVNLNDGESDGIPGISLTNDEMEIASEDYSDGSSVTVDLKNEVSGTSATTGVSYSQSDGDVKDQSSSSHELLESSDQVTKTDGAAPVVTEFEVEKGSRRATLAFSEAVNAGEDTAVSAGDLSYTDNSGDSQGISSVSHQTGTDQATVILNSQVTEAKDSDSIDVDTSGSLVDLAGNAGVSSSVTASDSRDQISLTEGWNLVSTPQLQAESTSELLSGVDYSGSPLTYDDGRWVESASEMSLDEMDAVYINSDKPQEIELDRDTGVQNTPQDEVIESGWSLVGPSLNVEGESELNADIDVAFNGADIGDDDSKGITNVVSPLGNWDQKKAEGFENEEVEAFRGYWVFSKSQEVIS